MCSLNRTGAAVCLTAPQIIYTFLRFANTFNSNVKSSVNVARLLLLWVMAANWAVTVQ